MPATIVLGAQWGDEGKGKLVDILATAPTVALVARAQGGNNAGHTILHNGQSYHFHLLPSGLMNPRAYNLLGSGVVVHVPSFFEELLDLEQKGLENVRERIFISDRCHVVSDLHMRVDGLEEQELSGNSIGTTKRGIGPCYSTKASRSGIRISDIFTKELFDRKIRELARGYKLRFGALLDDYDVESEISKFDTIRTELPQYVVDAVPFMTSAQQNDVEMVLEGANALLLGKLNYRFTSVFHTANSLTDLDYGTFPYVTSSNTGLGGIFTGLALNPTKISSIIGVVKAYATRVGSGPFPTENLDEVGTRLQELGQEFGVTTGRRRRCGWLDLVCVKFSTDINHYTALNLTKLDVLDTFEIVKIAIAYVHPETGEEVASFPADLNLLSKVEIVYHEMPGWNSPTTGVKAFHDLPKAARDYVEYIEQFVGVSIKYIGTGPGREAMVTR